MIQGLPHRDYEVIILTFTVTEMHKPSLLNLSLWHLNYHQQFLKHCTANQI